MKKDFIDIENLTPAEIEKIFVLAGEFKRGKFFRSFKAFGG